MTPNKIEQGEPMSRRRFLQALGVTTTGLTLAAAGVYYGAKIEPNNIDITQIPVVIRNLSPEFEGYRLVQISDIHAGSWMNAKRLMNVVNLVNQLEPDLVAITGDYVNVGRVSPVQDFLIDSLSLLDAPDGVASVLGNHDHYANVDQLIEVLKFANVKNLQNESFVIERGSAKLAIAGVDDIWEQKHDLPKTIASLPDDKTPAILLAHEPDFADESAATGRFALQLSGHSHGGQIRLPYVGAPILVQYGEKYPIGRYQVEDMVQYTNRGVGMELPIRIGCPPEITVFTLTQEPIRTASAG